MWSSFDSAKESVTNVASPHCHVTRWNLCQVGFKNACYSQTCTRMYSITFLQACNFQFQEKDKNGTKATGGWIKIPSLRCSFFPSLCVVENDFVSLVFAFFSHCFVCGKAFLLKTFEIYQVLKKSLLLLLFISEIYKIIQSIAESFSDFPCNFIFYSGSPFARCFDQNKHNSFSTPSQFQVPCGIASCAGRFQVLSH